MVKPVVIIPCPECHGHGATKRDPIMCRICLGARVVFVPENWKPGQPTGFSL